MMGQEIIPYHESNMMGQESGGRPPFFSAINTLLWDQQPYTTLQKTLEIMTTFWIKYQLMNRAQNSLFV